MTVKIWRGDAPARAQQTRITPSAVEIGDVFSVTINGKSVSVTSTAATASNVCSLLAAALAASTIPEFRELQVTNSGSSVLLTARTAGVPFVVSATASNGSSTGLTIATTREGSAAVSAVNMTQTFAIPVSAAGGFKIWCGGVSTASIAVGASAGTVQSALEGLAVIGSGNVSVAKTSDSNDDIYVCTFQGSLAATQVAALTCVLTTTKPVVRTTQQGSSTGTILNEIQTITFGDGWLFDGATLGNTYTLTHDSQVSSAIDLRSTAATVQLQLRNLLTLEDNDVNVTVSGNVLTVDFVLREGQTNQTQIVAGTISGSGSMSITISVSSTPAVSASAAVNELQSVNLTGSPTGGTFTLTWSGQTTSGIAWNASAASVVSALEALSNIGSGDVAATGSAGGPWTVEFTGTLAGANQPAMTGSGANLTGGSAQSVATATEVASSGPNHWDTAANWIPAGVPANADDVRFEIGSSDCLYGLDQSSVTLNSLQTFMKYTGKIGLPRMNSSGYLEYRTPELTIGADVILIGVGDGSGSGKIAINTGAVATAIEIRDSGGSSESGVGAISWRGSSTASTITMFGGDLSIAPYSDQTAVVDTLVQRGGTLDAKHTEFVTSLLFTSAKFFDCTLDGKKVEAY